MTPSMRYAILLAIVVYFVVLILMLRRKRLSLRYTLLWLFSGVVLLMLSLFPGLLRWVTSLLGFQVQSNALFAILFFFVLLILMSLTSITSKQNEYIKRLVQHTAVLEKRIRDLESEQGRDHDTAG